MDKEELKKHIYDPMPEETPKAFAAYCAYRDRGGSRTTDQIAKELSKSGTLIRRWAYTYAWTDRVFIYDLEQEKKNRLAFEDINREDHLKKLENYRQENENLGKAWRATGATLLIKIQKKIDNIKDGEIETRDLPGLTKVAETCTNLGDKLLAESLAVEKLLQQKLDEGL
jgi:hypothetical protein